MLDPLCITCLLIFLSPKKMNLFHKTLVHMPLTKLNKERSTDVLLAKTGNQVRKNASWNYFLQINPMMGEQSSLMDCCFKLHTLHYKCRRVVKSPISCHIYFLFFHHHALHNLHRTLHVSEIILDVFRWFIRVTKTVVLSPLLLKLRGRCFCCFVSH